jgi:phosphinothricin acetyltransferase
MTIIPCTRLHTPEILAIFNDAILNSTALYEYEPRTPAFMDTWFSAKEQGRFPLIGAVDDDGSLSGFTTYGAFRAFPAYKYSVEHSIYVHPQRRGRGIGRLLLKNVIDAAQADGRHTLIGGIDSANTASIRLHQSAGFVRCAQIREAGYKFGRWLDLEFYQLILPTPLNPSDAQA